MFSDVLFVDEYCRKHFKKIKKTIEKRKESPIYYVLELSTVTGRLEFYESKYYIQGYYDKADPYIVGLAQNCEHAVMITEEIISRCLSKGLDLNFVKYFDEICRNQKENRTKFLVVNKQIEVEKG